MNNRNKRAGRPGNSRQQATKPHQATDRQTADKPATVKEMLGEGTVAKLKARAEALQAEQARQAALKKQQAEEARQAERKRLENDFEYLLANSSDDWRKFK